MTVFNVTTKAAAVIIGVALAAPAWADNTGMNAPLVQQAQELLRRAVQIEIVAAQTPNDPRATAMAAALAGDLRGRAAIMMQVNSDKSRSQPTYCRLTDGRFVPC